MTGKIKTHIVLVNLYDFSNKYSGISPALKYKLNIKMKVNNVRPLSLFLDKGYAAQVVIIIPSKVNIIVTKIVYNIE